MQTYTYYFDLISSKTEKSHSRGAERVKYIYREEDSILGVKRIYNQERMPSWSDNCPCVFFDTADHVARKNAIIYREFQFTLPGQLNLQQNLQLANNIINEFIPNKYYALTIFQSNQPETPLLCYLLFSDRIIDDIELKQERSKDRFFTMYNSKRPETSGAKKDDFFTKLTNSNKLLELKSRYVDIVNTALAENNLEGSLDVSSYVGQYQSLLTSSATNVEELSNQILSQATSLDKLDELLQVVLRHRSHLMAKLASLDHLENEIKLRQEELSNAADSSKVASQTAPELITSSDLSEQEVISILNNDDKVPTQPQFVAIAYNHVQIRNLLSRLENYLQNLTCSIRNPIMDKSLVRMRELIRIVDKHFQENSSGYYFVKTDNDNSLEDYTLNPSTITDENVHDLTRRELSKTKMIDLRNAKIIAEAIAGNKVASDWVMKTIEL